MYADLISQKIRNVYQKGVATKILQGMDRIRNEFDELQARRWPTELLQNARDLAYPDLPVRVQIELTDDAVCFRHSGRPFSVKDILSIINQVSSKHPGEGVGQFGTGFMSTFQLSMQVDVRSFLKDEGEPYKPFCVRLDRSGGTYEAISGAIDEAIESLKAADRAPAEQEYDRAAFNTEFRYHLMDHRSRRIAQMGVGDLRMTLAHILLFSPEIGEAELLIHTEQGREELRFRRGADRGVPGGLRWQEILIGTQSRTFITLQRGEITLAAEWSEASGFQPVGPGAPRLYVGFPLVGSEQFPFPLVLNSLALRPNEPRSGISLVEHEESLDGRTNRELLDRAAAAYEDFFPALTALDHRGVEHLAAIPPQHERREWSTPWVRSHLYDRLYQFLAQRPILPVDGTLHTLAEGEMRLVWAETQADRVRLAALWRQVRGVLVPDSDVDWYGVFAGYQPPQEKCVTISGTVQEAAAVIARGLREGCGPVKWLARLYDLGMEQPETGAAIRAGDTAIFPSQRPEDLEKGRLYAAREMFTDPGISETLKDAAEQLDRLGQEDCLEVRTRLLHPDFQPETAVPLAQYSLSDFSDYIYRRADRGFRVRNYVWNSAVYNEAWARAWRLLLASGPDRELYELCQAGWEDLPPYEGKLSLFDGHMWTSTFRSVLVQQLDLVKAAKNLESWGAVLRARDAQTDAIQWLERFYGKTAQYLSVADLFWTPIIPNQYGIFRAPNDLKLDRIGDEEIKEISVCFKQERAACDILNDLVDRRLPMPGWNLSSMNLNEAAGGVNTALQRFLARTTLSEAPLALQEACTRLLSWIQDHPKEAGQHFPMFCEEEDQMKLLTPKAAVSLRKKADRLNNLLTIAQTDDLETLVQLVQRGTKLAGGSVEDGDDGWYDPDSGLYLDEGWNELDRRAREDRLRRIGEAGEFGVFRLAVAHFRDQNLSLEQDDGHVVRLVSPDGAKQVTITWPETEQYHQPGWDISVQIQQAGEAQEYFLEVKTHTPCSRVRSLIPLFDTQMQQAVRLGERYILVLAIYDEAAEQVVALDWFHSVLSSLADGTLHSAKGGFTLRHREELPREDEICLTIPA